MEHRLNRLKQDYHRPIQGFQQHICNWIIGAKASSKTYSYKAIDFIAYVVINRTC